MGKRGLPAPLPRWSVEAPQREEGRNASLPSSPDVGSGPAGSRGRPPRGRGSEGSPGLDLAEARLGGWAAEAPDTARPRVPPSTAG